MKIVKKINSISFGGKFLGAALLFTLALPAALRLALLIYNTEILVACAKISVGIGIFITLLFTVLLAVEFKQDKQLNEYFEARKKVKLYLGRQTYECQACGNKAVKAKDKVCGICGITFEDKGK